MVSFSATHWDFRDVSVRSRRSRWNVPRIYNSTKDRTTLVLKTSTGPSLLSVPPRTRRRASVFWCPSETGTVRPVTEGSRLQKLRRTRPERRRSGWRADPDLSRWLWGRRRGTPCPRAPLYTLAALTSGGAVGRAMGRRRCAWRSDDEPGDCASPDSPAEALVPTPFCNAMRDRRGGRRSGGRAPSRGPAVTGPERRLEKVEVGSESARSPQRAPSRAPRWSRVAGLRVVTRRGESGEERRVSASRSATWGHLRPKQKPARSKQVRTDQHSRFPESPVALLLPVEGRRCLFREPWVDHETPEKEKKKRKKGTTNLHVQSHHGGLTLRNKRM